MSESPPAVRNRGRERHVNLDNPLPVHLTYRTAWVDSANVFQFRGDIYGRDARVAKALHRRETTRGGDGRVKPYLEIERAAD